MNKEFSSSDRPPLPIKDLSEWNLLAGEAVAATPVASGEGDLTVEVKRTGLSLDCFMDAHQGDMSKFALLTDAQREDLHEEVRSIVDNIDAFDAVCYLLLTHDALKNREICDAMGIGPEVDHDQAYALLLGDPAHSEVRKRYLPGFDLLSPKGRMLVTSVAGLSSNYPQTLQGEAPGATLEAIHNEPDSLVRDVDILIKKFDIFGAMGHQNQDVSLTATPATFRRMKNLDNALRDPAHATAHARNNAFLDAELTDLLGPIPPQNSEELQELRVLARLACHLRVEDEEAFQRLLEDFIAQPAAVNEILLSELSREHRATLASYSPNLVKTITKQYGGIFALKFLAHVLQEAHIADGKARRAGLTGVATVQLDGLMRSIHAGEFDPTQNSIRFISRGNALVAVSQASRLENLDGLPDFTDGEKLRGKRIVLVGEGGGSDGIQAAMVGKLLAGKYGSEVVAVVSVRNTERVVSHTGQAIDTAIKEITPDTRAVGDWRFLEKIPLETDNPTPMYILNSTDSAEIKSNIETLVQTTGAEAVLGVDTGGDALYRELHAGFSAHLPTEITPDQDYLVVRGLAAMAEAQPDIPVLSVVVAPGVDTPPYAREVLDEAGASRLALSEKEVSLIRKTYADYRMDGSGNDEGRYGKTPLAWLHALKGNTGLQLLELPRANVISDANPWRAFTIITPAMAGVLVMGMKEHYDAIKRGE